MAMTSYKNFPLTGAANDLGLGLGGMPNADDEEARKKKAMEQKGLASVFEDTGLGSEQSPQNVKTFAPQGAATDLGLGSGGGLDAFEGEMERKKKRFGSSQALFGGGY